MAHASLATAAFLCSLVAGFVFAFAAIVMPGIRILGDHDFLRAFQVMDGVIQNNQPLFVLVWAGSVVAILAAVGLNIQALTGLDRALLVAAAAIYIVGVQLPTMTINVPLNNELQTLALGTMDADALASARAAFEARWNQWNVIRTGLASLSVGLMLALLVRL